MKEFPEEHFQTRGPVSLPGIDEVVRLPRNTWFRYDGAVPSLARNLAKTELLIRGVIEAERRGLQGLLDSAFDAWAVNKAEVIVRRDTPDVDSLLAYCYAHRVKDGRVNAFVIAKRNTLEPSLSLFADGHESGEFLQKINQQTALQDILEANGVRLDVSRYRGEEFADIPGLLAIMKAMRAGIQGIRPPVFCHRPPILTEQMKAFGF